MNRICIGTVFKARFWPGEAIWAKVTAINGGAIDAVLDNDPAPAWVRPPGFEHYASELKCGDPVSCGIDEVLEIA